MSHSLEEFLATRVISFHHGGQRMVHTHFHSCPAFIIMKKKKKYKTVYKKGRKIPKRK